MSHWTGRNNEDLATGPVPQRHDSENVCCAGDSGSSELVGIVYFGASVASMDIYGLRLTLVANFCESLFM